jgi:DNA-binding MarR family transcriptional regulator
MSNQNTGGEMTARRSTFQSKRAQIRIKRLLALLEDRTLSSSEIAKKLYCDQSLVTEYLRHLRTGPSRRARIADYEVVNGTKRALYGLGSEPDAPLTRQTNQERYAKVQADPVKYERHLTKARDLHRRKRATVPPEQRQRDRRIYEPPLPVQVVDLLKRMPGCTNEQIADRLQANERAVQRVTQRLSKTGAIQRAKASTMKKWQWETPDRPMAFVPRVARQTIFAALGI